MVQILDWIAQSCTLRNAVHCQGCSCAPWLTEPPVVKVVDIQCQHPRTQGHICSHTQLFDSKNKCNIMSLLINILTNSVGTSACRGCRGMGSTGADLQPSECLCMSRSTRCHASCKCSTGLSWTRKREVPSFAKNRKEPGGMAATAAAVLPDST